MNLGTRWRFWAFLTLAALPVIAGCNDGSVSASGSTTEATVSGTVMIQGKLATEGEVVFDPANINRRDAQPRRASIDKDGHYSIKTLVGSNMATVENPVIARNGLQVANRQAIEITSGENAFDIRVPAESKPNATAPPISKGGRH